MEFDSIGEIPSHASSEMPDETLDYFLNSLNADESKWFPDGSVLQECTDNPSNNTSYQSQPQSSIAPGIEELPVIYSGNSSPVSNSQTSPPYSPQSQGYSNTKPIQCIPKSNTQTLHSYHSSPINDLRESPPQEVLSSAYSNCDSVESAVSVKQERLTNVAVRAPDGTLYMLPHANIFTADANQEEIDMKPEVAVQSRAPRIEINRMETETNQTTKSTKPKKKVERNQAHNVIEKRYRHSINDRIEELKSLLGTGNDSKMSKSG